MWPKFPRSHQGIQIVEQGGLAGDQGIVAPCRSERVGAPPDLLEQSALERLPSRDDLRSTVGIAETN